MQLPPSAPGIPGQPQQKSGTWNTLRGCALAVVGLVVLSCVGIFGVFLYQGWQSDRLFAAAQEKQAAGDYAGAVTDLETLMRDYESFEEADEAVKLLPQVNLEWANALREEQQFEAALEKYVAVTDKELADQVREGQLETRADWGDALLTEQQFTAAQEQYEQVLAEEEAGTPLGDRVRAALPDVYVGLAEEAREAGDVQTAFARLNYVFQNYQTGAGRDKAVATFTSMTEPLYNLTQQQRTDGKFADAESALVAITTYTPDTPLATQVQSELPAFYLEWGQALVAADNFEDAVKVYQYLLDTYPDSEVAAQASAALVDAEVAAIARSGEAGVLPPPQAAGSSGGELAVYDVSNDTVCPIVVLLSGPQSQAVKLAPQTNQQVETTAGTYNIVVKTDDDLELSSDCQNIIPFTGQNEMEAGMIYQSSFYIETVSN